jgi:hypothetical protein
MRAVSSSKDSGAGRSTAKGRREECNYDLSKVWDFYS